MREGLEQWLAAASATPGVVVAGVRLTEHVCLSRSADDKYPRDRFEMACQLAAEFATLLSEKGVTLSRLQWRFREGVLHYFRRPDGVAIGLLTEPDTVKLAEFQGLVTVFEAMI